MASKTKSNDRIFIKILWGDADLGEISTRFPSLGNVSAGRGLFADLKTKIWPLREDLVILERESGRIFLNSAIPWHGIITSGDSIHLLDPRKRRRKILEIKKNTTASLRYEDITIAIRVGKVHQPYKSLKPIANKFRGHLLGLVADNKFEKISLSFAVVMAFVLTMSAYMGLKKRSVWRPESVSEISNNFRIPFMSPDHFSTAPNVLQEKLDRFDYVNSVSDFYTELAGTLTGESNTRKNKLISSEVRANYSAVFEKQSEQLERFKQANAKVEKEIKGRGGKLLSMAVIEGESLNGSMQRVLDKISILESTAKELSETRIAAGEAYKNDPSYDYGDKGGVKPDTLADFTKKLGEGFRSVLPDEEQQIAEAKGFAVDVTAAQIALFGKDSLKSGVNDCCGELVGVIPGVSPIKYFGEVDLKNSDRNLAELKASIWGDALISKAPQKSNSILMGIIDEKAVEKSIARGRFQLQLCFELALRRNQSAKGTMEWKWQIDTQGQLSQLSLLKSTLDDQELIQCVRQKIATWKFPKPKGGSVVIRYPFEFTKDKG